MSTHKLCFQQKYKTYQNFLSENFHFLVVKCSIYLNRRVFVILMRTHNIHLLWRNKKKILNLFSKALLISIHNMCFYGEIRKIFI